jgi:hypothetical protein
LALLLVDRFHPRLCREQQVAIDAGMLHKCDELKLLEPQQLRPLALLSLLMLIAGTIFFAALNLVAYYWQMQAAPSGMTLWGVVLWLGINVLGYIIILPIHEIVHALAFIFWGGRPYFGAKLPLALYCGAKNQLFRRNHYLVIGLAPLVMIGLASILVTLFSPALASYMFFATVGNFSGAAGDVLVAARLLRLSPNVLLEDIEAGYRAWKVLPN